MVSAHMQRTVHGAQIVKTTCPQAQCHLQGLSSQYAPSSGHTTFGFQIKGTLENGPQGDVIPTFDGGGFAGGPLGTGTTYPVFREGARHSIHTPITCLPALTRGSSSPSRSHKASLRMRKALGLVRPVESWLVREGSCLSCQRPRHPHRAQGPGSNKWEASSDGGDWGKNDSQVSQTPPGACIHLLELPL